MQKAPIRSAVNVHIQSDEEDEDSREKAFFSFLFSENEELSDEVDRRGRHQRDRKANSGKVHDDEKERQKEVFDFFFSEEESGDAPVNSDKECNEDYSWSYQTDDVEEEFGEFGDSNSAHTSQTDSRDRVDAENLEDLER